MTTAAFEPMVGLPVPILTNLQLGEPTRKRTRPSSELNETLRKRGGLHAVAADPEEQQLLRELADLTGGSTTTDALQRALERLKGCSPPASTCPSPAHEALEEGEFMEFDEEDEDFLDCLADIPCATAEPAAGRLPTLEPEAQLTGMDYARVMDSHGFGLVLMDMSGRFLHWNQTMEQVLGYNSQQMRHLSMMHVTPVEDLPAMMQLMPRLLGGPGHQPPTIASPLHLMKRCVTRTGQDLKFHVRMSVMSAADAPIAMRGHGGADRLISCLVDCHGPHTWELPTQSFVAAQSSLCAFARLAAQDSPALSPQAAAATATGGDVPVRAPRRPTDGAAESSASKKPKTRVPLPRQAVAELRDLLSVSLYPEPQAREAISQRYGLDRKRVDRWLENTRARQVALAKAAAEKHK